MSGRNSTESGDSESRRTEADLLHQITDNQTSIQRLSEALMPLLLSNLAATNMSQHGTDKQQQTVEQADLLHQITDNQTSIQRLSEMLMPLLLPNLEHLVAATNMSQCGADKHQQTVKGPRTDDHADMRTCAPKIQGHVSFTLQ